MNYRHIYHAGNFADVFKHIILARIIEYYKIKEAPFRIIDTHAGIGIYHLFDSEAQKTLEWQSGVTRFLKQDFDKIAQDLIKPWQDSIVELNKQYQQIKFYPGSPQISRFLIRKQDRLTAIELHSTDYKKLLNNYKNDFQTKIINLDGWLATKSQLPCKEKRAIILIDPPFEEEGEYQRLVLALQNGYKRSKNSTYILWYPIKYAKEHQRFLTEIKNTEIKNILRCEIYLAPLNKNLTSKNRVKTSLPGCGLIVVNPPYILKDELMHLQPYFSKGLQQSKPSEVIIEQFMPES